MSLRVARSLSRTPISVVLGDRNQHDVHHADAADEQAEAGKSDRDEHDHRKDGVEATHDLVGGEVEVVLRWLCFSFMKELADLLERLSRMPGRALER